MEAEKGSVKRALIFLLLAATPVGIALAIGLRQVYLYRQFQKPIIEKAEGSSDEIGIEPASPEEP